MLSKSPHEKDRISCFLRADCFVVVVTFDGLSISEDDDSATCASIALFKCPEAVAPLLR